MLTLNETATAEKVARIDTSFLKKLGLKSQNNGVSTGSNWWASGNGKLIASYSPVDGQLIGRVKPATRADYDQAIEKAQAAFEVWRTVPAPKRGEIVRQFGNQLRLHKDALGRLVSYEMGKSLQEGWGEVQEMIDICDFAVGLSRQLYGLTMHSERPLHRMYEQWHPLWNCGRHFGLQLSGSRLGLECGVGLGMRQCVRVETVGKNAAVGYRYPTHF